MNLIYESQLWRAAIGQREWDILKDEQPDFKISIQRNAEQKIVKLSELAVPEYPSEVKARLDLGWEIIAYTQYSIVLGSQDMRMSYDRTHGTFSKPWKKHE
jgi:hypothetical protein